MMSMQTYAAFPANQPPTEEPLLAILMAAQKSHQLFPLAAAGQKVQPQPVVVAVSGGADSIALLHLLAQCAATWQFALHVAHVDHNLRPTAASDATFVRTVADALGLPCHMIRLDDAALRADPSGLEAAARSARYQFLCTTAHDITPRPLIPIVAVAHHAGDQAETVLLRLVQGSGLRGLAGMRPATMLQGAADSRPVRLVRPLLAAPRSAILDYVRRNGLTWREDESNADNSRTRNRLRNTVLPALAHLTPDVSAALSRTATLLAEESDRLQAVDEEGCQRLSILSDETRIVLQLVGLRTLAHTTRRAVLRVALAKLAHNPRHIDYAQLEALATAAERAGGHTGPHPLPHELAWSIVTDLTTHTLCLALHRRNALPVPPPGPWLPAAWRAEAGSVALTAGATVHVGEWMLTCNTLALSELSLPWQQNVDRWVAYFDRAQIGTPVLDVVRSGVKMAPFGMGGRHKPVGDLFTDRKIAPPLREGWPIIYDQASGTVLWVCGLVRSEHARVTASTQLVWVMQWVRAEEC